MCGHGLNLTFGLLLSIVMYSVEGTIEVPTPTPTPTPLPGADPIVELNKDTGDSCCK